MPGDVLMIQGLDLRGVGASMYGDFADYAGDYAGDYDGFGDLIPSMGGLGALIPSGHEMKETAIAGAGLAIGLSGMLMIERFVQRQYKVSAKVLPLIDLLAGYAIGKGVAMWINPMFGAAITAAGAALAVMRFFKGWLGYSMGFSGLGEDLDGFGEDLDGFDAAEDELGDYGEDYLSGFDQITTSDVGAVVPELA